MTADGFYVLIPSGVQHLARSGAIGGYLWLRDRRLEAGHGFGVTREFLRTAFGEPRRTGTRIDDIAVSARTDGREHSLSGFLLRTTRAAGA